MSAWCFPRHWNLGCQRFCSVARVMVPSSDCKAHTLLISPSLLNLIMSSGGEKILVAFGTNRSRHKFSTMAFVIQESLGMII